MHTPIRAVALISIASAVLSAQAVFPSDTADAFNSHILARLSGSGSDIVTAIRTGAAGEIYVAGNTTSADFPVRNAAQADPPDMPAMRSTDGGRTWTRFNPPPSNGAMQDIRVLRAHPTVPGLLFAISGATLWRTADAGQTWEASYVAPPREENQPGAIGLLGFDELAPATIYLSANDQFSISQDGGQTWQTKEIASGAWFLRSASPLTGEPKIVSDPRGSGALIANSEHAAALSRDRGATWTELRASPVQTSSVATFSRTRDGRIYAGVAAGAAGSLWVSDNWGQTWTQTRAQPGYAVVDLFTAPDAPDALYVTTLAPLRVSPDGGETWSNPNDSVSLNSQVSLASGCASGSLLVATQGQRQITTSADRGQTWQLTPLQDIQRFTAGAGCSIYILKTATVHGFVARLDQTGAIEWSTYLADYGPQQIFALSADPTGNVLVAGTIGNTRDILLAKYTPDGRLLWKKALGGDQHDTPLDIVADPGGNIIVVGRTNSSNFPVTPGVARTAPAQGFALKLSPSGDVLWATYLELIAQSAAIEPSGAILIAGSDQLVRLGPSGIGIERVDTIVPRPALVRTDASGNVFLAGTIHPGETPLTPGAYASPIRARQCDNVSWGGPYYYVPQADLQIARLRPRTLEPDFSALLGGECGSYPNSLDVMPDGRVTIGFVTQSQAFDLRAPIASAGFCRSADLATGVAQLSADGSQLLRSTVLDGCSAVRVAARESTIYAASDNTDQGLVLKLDAPPTTGPRVDHVSNAFSGTGFGIAPGELVTLRGASLGPADALDLGISPQTALPVELGGTQVLFNGTTAPILRAAANEIIFAAPSRIPGASATIQVLRNGQTSNEVLVPVVAASPALLAAGFPFTNPESEPLANARNADGTLNGPSNPAKAGTTVWVFATGLGATNIEVESGMAAATDALRPATGFRDAANLPLSYNPFEPPREPAAIRAMPGFLNSIFAVPVTASAATDGQRIRLTSAQYLRGTARRSFSPAVIIYVCTPDATGNCPASERMVQP